MFSCLKLNLPILYCVYLSIDLLDLIRIFSRSSEFLSFIVSYSDRLVSFGDINIHVCCLTKPLVYEFLTLVDAFNLAQLVSSHTYQRCVGLGSYTWPLCR